MHHGGYVYILGSRSLTLYVGVTADLERRLWMHKRKAIPGFTARYNIDRLLHVEAFEDIASAIAREKQIKRWRREKKLELIRGLNPDLRDLSDAWYRAR